MTSHKAKTQLRIALGTCLVISGLFFSPLLMRANMMCPTNITFSTQSEIDNFQSNYPGCTSITGSVTITGTDITNLNGINGITSIGGFLNISNNPSLGSLTGLSNLTSIGTSLFIISCTALTNLNGLGSLTSIGTNLGIQSNTNLVNLSGLSSSITTIPSHLSIQQNPALNSL